MHNFPPDTKTCLVTGANVGIGFEMALSLASKGHTVLVLCRDKQKANTAAEKILSRIAHKNVFPFFAELSSQSEIKRVAEEIKTQYSELDVLINNAGCVSSTYKLTADGVETQFAVNHLAPFLLTHYLLPLLKKSNNGRIINVNSRAHGRATIHFDDIFLSKKYDISKAYNQSKLANMFFTYSLAEKLKGCCVTVNAFHPGLVKTYFGSKGVSSFHKLAWDVMRVLGRNPSVAAQDGVHLALSSDVQNITESYFHNQIRIKSSAQSYDKEWAKRLWEISLKLTNLKAEEYGAY